MAVNNSFGIVACLWSNDQNFVCGEAVVLPVDGHRNVALRPLRFDSDHKVIRNTRIAHYQRIAFIPFCLNTNDIIVPFDRRL